MQFMLCDILIENYRWPLYVNNKDPILINLCYTEYFGGSDVNSMHFNAPMGLLPFDRIIDQYCKVKHNSNMKLCLNEMKQKISLLHNNTFHCIKIPTLLLLSFYNISTFDMKYVSYIRQSNYSNESPQIFI